MSKNVILMDNDIYIDNGYYTTVIDNDIYILIDIYIDIMDTNGITLYMYICTYIVPIDDTDQLNIIGMTIVITIGM